MQRYTIGTPLIAVRLCRLSDSDKAGVMTSLPGDAIVEIQGPSHLGTGMVEASWQRQRYAVFELDLTTRATPEPCGSDRTKLASGFVPSPVRADPEACAGGAQAIHRVRRRNSPSLDQLVRECSELT